MVGGYPGGGPVGSLTNAFRSERTLGWTAMADLERSGSRLPRRTREQRAYRLAVATGVLGTIGAVGIVLAIVGIGSFALSLLAIVLAAVCGLLFRRTVS